MSTPTVGFPRPVPDEETAPFWQGCREQRLLLQHCSDCRTWRFPPRPVCAQCRSTAYEWSEASGRGVVASFTICHPPVLPAFADRVPYNVVVVQLEEGPHLVSNLVSGEPSVGMAVEVTYVDVDDDLTLPQFAPADG